MHRDNLFSDLPESLPSELIDVLAESDRLRIERIVSTGQTSPNGFWYDQSEDEWVVVLKGEAELRLEGSSDPIRLVAGDHLWIPAHRKHRVERTSCEETTVWLAVFDKQSDAT